MTPRELALLALLTGSWGEQSLLPGRPAWMADAACIEHPEVEFVPASARKEETADEARATCRGCLCRVDCAAFALADPALVGIWAGTTTAERRALRKRWAAA